MVKLAQTLEEEVSGSSFLPRKTLRKRLVYLLPKSMQRV